MKPRHASKPGFTLIELLVAISLTVLMLALIDTLFRDTTQAVTRGVATGKIIQEGLVISDQIARDAEHMLGPGADGVLVIGQKEYGGPLADQPRLAKPQVVADREGGTTGVTRIGGEIARAVRSDQLLFFRNNTGAAETFPVAPAAENTYAPSNASLGAGEARVWYGHLAKTNELGTDAVIARSTDEDTLSGPDIMGDVLANRWYFGRQPLFFSSTYGGIEARGGGPAFLNVAHTAEVQGYSIPTSLESDMGGTWLLYGGLTDVAEATAADVGSSLAGRTLPNGYATGGVALLYSRKRLRANPEPIYGSTSEYQYQAWQIAQMHPILARGVSDFIVEFAGDYDDDDDATTYGVRDGQIDLDSSGNIRWYTHDTFANGGGVAGEPDTYSFEPVRTAYSRVTDDGATSGEAYYVTEADMTSGSYAVSPVVTHVDGVFVFRHDDDDPATGTDPSLWPYLIRVRFRLHDIDGVVMQGDGQHGKWFETIIAVNRP